GRQRLLRGLDERGEDGGLVDGQLGKHATVDLHTCETQTLDEAVVREAVLAARGVDALDPQAAEVALALATVAVRVDERVGDLLLRLAVQTRTLTPVTGGALKDDATLLVGVYCPLDSSHFVLLPNVRRRSVAEELLGDLGITLGEDLVL